MNTNDLKTLGWDKYFEGHFQPYTADGYVAGRIASEYKHFYCVYSESGKVLGEGCDTRLWTEETYQWLETGW
jgi:hypothetical protein